MPDNRSTPPKSKWPTRKEMLEARKGLVYFRGDLVKKRNQLRGQTRSLKKQAKAQAAPVWADQVYDLYSQPDYSFWKMLRILRKHKIL
ncbi:hypothetical protein [Paenibacillus senegalensis]|uniref:hypothetical protein n=1 Tax=Paenibacillus senegalensis TaxID=1465766 RepID=UPI0002893BCC|nr:hypothetical protein [Paenibacillus senegalensis]